MVVEVEGGDIHSFIHCLRDTRLFNGLYILTCSLINILCSTLQCIILHTESCSP